MKSGVFDYVGAFGLGLALFLLLHAVNHPAPPQLDYVAPGCSLHTDGSWYVNGVIHERGSLGLVKHAKVLVAAGSSVQYLQANDLSVWGVTVPADKYGIARVQVLEVLVPSYDGKMVAAAGPMPSVTCRPDADDGGDQ